MDKKGILILGGGALNIKCVLEAKEHGFFTYVADANPNAPCFKISDCPIVADITSYEDLRQKIRHFPIQGVVSMAEAGVVAAAKLSEYLGTGGINVEAAMNCTSKVLMRAAWKDTAYSVPFRVVRSLDETYSAAHELGSFPMIMKPDRTFGGSRGVSKIFSKHDLKSAYEYAASSGLNELIVLELCAEGPEYSCEVVVSDGVAQVLCVGQKIKSPAPYRVDCSVRYPAILSDMNDKEISNMCQVATKAVGINDGVAHVEFALTSGGPKLFELGARCGGGHTPMIAKHVSGVNEFISYCKIACGISPDVLPYKIKKGADYRFIIFEPGKVDEVMIPESLRSMAGIYDLVVTPGKGEEIGRLINTSARSGAVVVFTESVYTAVSLADEVCRAIKIRYSDGKVSNAQLFEN